MQHTVLYLYSVVYEWNFIFYRPTVLQKKCKFPAPTIIIKYYYSIS